MSSDLGQIAFNYNFSLGFAGELTPMGFPVFNNSSCISILHVKCATLTQKIVDTFMSFVSSHLERLAFKTFDAGNNDMVYSYGSRQKTKDLARRNGYHSTMYGSAQLPRPLIEQ